MPRTAQETVVPTSGLGRLLIGLLNCVCAAFTDDGRPVCRCSVRWAIQWPSMTGCKCDCDDGNGEAWTQLVRMQQNVTVTAASGAACLNTASATVNVGYHRCVTSAGTGGSVPSPETYTTDSLGLLADEETIRRTLTCCEVPGWQITAGSFQPLGPAGGCAGGYVQATCTPIIGYRSTP